MSEISENSDFFSGPQAAALELPFLAQIDEIRGGVSFEIAQRLYYLGREAGIILSREQAALEANPVSSEATFRPDSLGERSWCARAGLRTINGAPVAEVGNLRNFESTVMGANAPNLAIRVMNALQRGHSNRYDLNNFGEMLLTQTIFYKADESRAKRGEKFTYLDLLSLTNGVEPLIEAWRGVQDFNVLPGLNSRGLRFLLKFLNHALQLNPPLETY